MRRPLILAALLCSCVTPPQRFRYNNLPPNLKIIYASQASVQRHFLKKGGRTLDNGENFNPKTHKIRCFYSPGTNTIFVGRGEDSCLAHELKHFEGVTPEEADRFHVRDQ